MACLWLSGSTSLFPVIVILTAILEQGMHSGIFVRYLSSGRLIPSFQRDKGESERPASTGCFINKFNSN